MIWATATKVGCAYIESLDTEGNYYHDVTCLYNTGNVANQPVASTTGCPSGTTLQGSTSPYPGLCYQTGVVTDSNILTAAWPSWIPQALRNPATRLLNEDKEFDLYDDDVEIVHFGKKLPKKAK